jgi:hypothetical protein
VKQLGVLRLIGLTAIVSLALVAYALTPEWVSSWNTSITATGQVQAGEFGPLEAIVDLQPDVLTLADVGGNVEARVRIPGGDVRLIEPVSVRVCAGFQACGDAGSPPSAFSVDEGEATATVYFVVADAISLPAEEELPADGVVVSVAVSGEVGGRTFVGTDALLLMPAGAEPVTSADETPTVSGSPSPDPDASPSPTSVSSSG